MDKSGQVENCVRNKWKRIARATSRVLNVDSFLQGKRKVDDSIMGTLDSEHDGRDSEKRVKYETKNLHFDECMVDGSLVNDDHTPLRSVAANGQAERSQ